MFKNQILILKKYPISYFFIKLFFLFLLVFLLDYSIGSTLKYFYFKQESGLQYRTTYSIEKTNADLLIFGSSRANHHYNPTLFENRMKLSYYNVGRDGNFIFYHYAVLRCILKRHTPKVIILDFIGGEFEVNKDSYDRLSSILPYYNSHPEIKSIIELRSKYEKLMLQSSIYPYNSNMFTIAVGNMDFNKKRKSDIKGYVPLTRVWDGVKNMDSTLTNYKIDNLKINTFKSFIKDCKKAHVKLYIICSPYLFKSNQTDLSIKIAKKITKSNNVIFLDYSRDSYFCKHPEYFSDLIHLNNDGSIKYSGLIIDSIQKLNHLF